MIDNDEGSPESSFEATRRQIREKGEQIRRDSAAIEARFEQTKREVDETAREVDAEIAEFDRQWEADHSGWDDMEQAMANIARDFFQAIRGGKAPKLEHPTIRTVAQFERLLDWHEESSKLWRNGYISDDLQAEISRQFSVEAMATWRLDLMEDPATPDEVLALQERMAEVCEHAAFLVGHIERKAADAQPQPPGAKPVLG